MTTNAVKPCQTLPLVVRLADQQVRHLTRGVGTPLNRATSNPAADAAMERYSQGDSAAFGELYEALVPRLYGYLLRKVRDRARAEDLVQQTLLNVHSARGRFVPGSRVTPWVYAIAKRLFLDQVKRKRIELLLPSGAVDEGVADQPGPEARTECRQLEALLRTEVERLSLPQRDVFELVVHGQMSHAEAAEVLGITVASVKLRLQRANHAIRSAILSADAGRRGSELAVAK